MKALSWTTLFALAIAAFLSQPIAAQDKTAEMTVPEFLQKIAADNWMEIQVSNMAQYEAKYDEVKDYARQREADHTVNLVTIERYAEKHGIALSIDKNDFWKPSSVQSDKDRARLGDREKIFLPVIGNAVPGSLAYSPKTPSALAYSDANHWRDLSDLHGRDFDRAYLETMVEDQQKTIATLERLLEAKIGDYELRYYINSTARVYRNRLSAAQALLGRL